MQLFKQGEFSGALTEFRHAQAVVPHFRVLFNIARACEELHDAACAIAAYRQYLQEGKGLDSARVAEVNASIAGLEGAVGKRRIAARNDWRS